MLIIFWLSHQNRRLPDGSDGGALLLHVPRLCLHARQSARQAVTVVQGGHLSHVRFAVVVFCIFSLSFFAVTALKSVWQYSLSAFSIVHWHWHYGTEVDVSHVSVSE